MINKPKFSIGDKVYHLTPESSPGIIINIIYYFNTQKYTYVVATGWNEESYCDEFELSLERNII